MTSSRLSSSGHYVSALIPGKVTQPHWRVADRKLGEKCSFWMENQTHGVRTGGRVREGKSPFLEFLLSIEKKTPNMRAVSFSFLEGLTEDHSPGDSLSDRSEQLF